MFLIRVILLALIDFINGYVLSLNLKGSNVSNVACNFDNSGYISLYKNLRNATTFSIQYTCTVTNSLDANSAEITLLNISQSTDYKCGYNCSYTEPIITCTRQRKDDNTDFAKENVVRIVSLNDSNPSDICIPTIWPKSIFNYFLWQPSIVLNTTCEGLPKCDIENESYSTRFEQTLSSSPSTPLSAERNSTSLILVTSLSSTLSPASLPPTTTTSPANDTDTKIIIGACVGGGLFLILCLVIIIVLICIKRNKRLHKNRSFTVSDNEINNSSKPKEQLVENKDKTEQEHPIVTSHIGNYINGIQIVNNKVDIPVNDYELPEYNTSTNSFRLNNTSNIKNNRISETNAHLEQNYESSNVNLEQKLNENNSDTEDFGYSTTEDVSTKNDVYSKLGEDAREFQNPYNVMPDDGVDSTNLKSKPFSTERAQHEDNMPASANVQQVDDSHLSHPSSGDVYAQVVKIKL